MIFGRKSETVTAEAALPGRDEPIPSGDTHFVSGTSFHPPFPDGMETAVFALGCFWGEEKMFWQVPGVHTTAVGYAGGHTPNPTYEEVCSGLTGHAEAVQVVFDPDRVAYQDLLAHFWEAHDPTQGMRQGNDHGTQYRSAIYTAGDDQLDAAKRSRDHFQQRLALSRFGEITTEIEPIGSFFYADEYHQQYLAKNPQGYCPDHSCGIEYLPEP